MSSSTLHRVIFAGLLLFGLSLPLSKSASSVLIALLYLLAIAGAVQNKEFRAALKGCRRPPLTAALVFFSFVAYVGVFYTESYAVGFGVANKFVSLPIVYFFVAAFVQSAKCEEARDNKAESLLIAFLAGLTALNLVGAATFLGATGTAKFTLPLAPLGLHHIWYSNINALGLYTAASFLLFTRRGATAGGRALLCGFLILSTLAILLSTSRTAWFGIAVTAAAMAVVLIRDKKKVFFAVLVSVLALSLVYQFVPLVHDRLNLVAEDAVMFSADRNPWSSVGARLSMWRFSLMMFAHSPIIGIGTGDYYDAIVKWNGGQLVPDALLEYNQPHNMYLFSLATNGILGLTALLYIFYRALRLSGSAIRSDNGAKFLAFLAMATTIHFMVAGFLDSFFNIQILRYCFAFIMGVCLRSSVKDSRP